MLACNLAGQLTEQLAMLALVLSQECCLAQALTG